VVVFAVNEDGVAAHPDFHFQRFFNQSQTLVVYAANLAEVWKIRDSYSAPGLICGGHH
jgi:hypothetical protein